MKLHLSISLIALTHLLGTAATFAQENDLEKSQTSVEAKLDALECRNAANSISLTDLSLTNARTGLVLQAYAASKFENKTIHAETVCFHSGKLSTIDYILETCKPVLVQAGKADDWERVHTLAQEVLEDLKVVTEFCELPIPDISKAPTGRVAVDFDAIEKSFTNTISPKLNEILKILGTIGSSRDSK